MHVSKLLFHLLRYSNVPRAVGVTGWGGVGGTYLIIFRLKIGYFPAARPIT